MSLTPFHLKIVHKLLCNKHRCCCAMQRLVAVLAVADEFCVPQSSHTIVSVRSQPCILWQQEHGMIPFPRQSCTLGTARQSSLTYITTARHVSQMSGECGESVYLPLVASLMTLLPLSTVLGAIGSSVHVQSCTVYLGASSHKPEKHSRTLHVGQKHESSSEMVMENIPLHSRMDACLRIWGWNDELHSCHTQAPCIELRRARQ